MESQLETTAAAATTTVTTSSSSSSCPPSPPSPSEPVYPTPVSLPPYQMPLEYSTSCHVISLARPSLAASFHLHLTPYVHDGKLLGVVNTTLNPWNSELKVSDVITHVDGISCESIFEGKDGGTDGGTDGGADGGTEEGKQEGKQEGEQDGARNTNDISGIIPHLVTKTTVILQIHRWTLNVIPVCHCGGERGADRADGDGGRHFYDCLVDYDEDCGRMLCNDDPYPVRMNPLTFTSSWLNERKRTWRLNSRKDTRVNKAQRCYEGCYEDPSMTSHWYNNDDANTIAADTSEEWMRKNFFRSSHYSDPCVSFDEWYLKMSKQWKAGYSWTVRRKARVLEEKKTVRVSQGIQQWLDVRREEWRFGRFRRTREITRDLAQQPNEPNDDRATLNATLDATLNATLKEECEGGQPDRRVRPNGGALPARRLSNKRVQALLSDVVAALKKSDNKKVFLYPVTEAIAPGYFSVVENGLCLMDVEERLGRGDYDAYWCEGGNAEGSSGGGFDRDFLFKTFHDDVKLIFGNCYKYNVGKEGKKIRAYCAKVEKVYGELCAKLVEDAKREEEEGCEAVSSSRRSKIVANDRQVGVNGRKRGRPTIIAAIGETVGEKKMEDGKEIVSTSSTTTVSSSVALSITLPAASQPDLMRLSSTSSSSSSSFTPTSKRFKLTHDVYGKILDKINAENKARAKRPHTLAWLYAESYLEYSRTNDSVGERVASDGIPQIQDVPDDVVYVMFSFLVPRDVVQLCNCVANCVTEGTAKRSHLFESMTRSNKKWVIPLRPRGSWFTLYFKKLREYTEIQRKLSDEVLLEMHSIIMKGDMLAVFKKVLTSAMNSFGYDVNYSSGLVLERNSALNMAVIENRIKIVKYLLLEEKADIETQDRGGFTPLLNAAWNNNAHMTRFLLSLGARRDQIGVTHSSKGFVAGFKGLTAENWARKRGFHDLADEIRFGLKS